jgi:hypothetical protein
MKPLRTNPVVLACLMAALFSGCSHKKPVVVPTAAAPQPAPQPAPAEPQPQTQESQAATQGTPPPEQQPAEPAAEQTEKVDTNDANKTKTAKPHATGKRGGPETARNTPPKTVVKSDAAETTSASGQISPSLSNAEVAHNQVTTEQLLQSTETNLNGIKRQLSQDEQAIVTQIRDFMNQSRQATKANDLTRAYNLALKARLLSDDLAKRK